MVVGWGYAFYYTWRIFLISLFFSCIWAFRNYFQVHNSKYVIQWCILFLWCDALRQVSQNTNPNNFELFFLKRSPLWCVMLLNKFFKFYLICNNVLIFYTTSMITKTCLCYALTFTLRNVQVTLHYVYSFNTLIMCVFRFNVLEGCTSSSNDILLNSRGPYFETFFIYSLISLF